MNQQAAQRAIKSALAGRWNEAVEYNLQILKNEPQNTEALNRLARAYASLGQTKNARRTWNKVLSLDRYNPIAQSQIQKLKSNLKGTTAPFHSPKSGEIFLDEPGKTKTTQLVRLADAKTLMSLEPGQHLKLEPKKRLITVSNLMGQYLGALPDDLSLHLTRLVRGGNKYDVLVRRVEKNNIHVFIKETKKAKRYINTPSFPRSKMTPLIPLENTGPINETPIDVVPTGEEVDYS